MYDNNNSFINYRKYCMIFDTNKLPLDFDKWIQLPIESNDLKNTANLNNCLLLNTYYSIVVDADIDFNVVIGGSIYKLKKGKKYFPVFPLYHDFYVQISLYVKIFIESNIYESIKINKNSFNNTYHSTNELTELFYYYIHDFTNNNNILNNYTYIFTNVDILDCENKNHDLISKSGMMGDFKLNCKNTDVDKFYFVLEKNNKNYLIQLLDKYIQYEFIKICELL